MFEREISHKTENKELETIAYSFFTRFNSLDLPVSSSLSSAVEGRMLGNKARSNAIVSMLRDRR